MSTKKTKTGSKKEGARTASLTSEAYEAALQEFEAAVEALHSGKFRDAAEKFRTIAASHAEEFGLAGRARTYVAVCERRLAEEAPAPQGAEETYRAGVAAANDGRLDEAGSLLDRAVAERPSEASYLYARATVRALQGAADRAAQDLRRAIEIDPKVRFQAVNDPDFDVVRDEAVFIDVIEPSPTGA